MSPSDVESSSVKKSRVHLTNDEGPSSHHSLAAPSNFDSNPFANYAAGSSISTATSATAKAKTSVQLAPIFRKKWERKVNTNTTSKGANGIVEKKRKVDTTSSDTPTSAGGRIMEGDVDEAAKNFSVGESTAKGGGDDEEKDAIVDATTTKNGELLFCLTVSVF